MTRPVALLSRFWHHWCVHASAYNGSDKVRQAVIARFHSTLPGFPLLWDDGGVGPFDPPPPARAPPLAQLPIQYRNQCGRMRKCVRRV